MRKRVVGVGHPRRGDDALGLLAARLAGGTELADGAALIEAFEGADAVVVLDAMRSGRPPGTLERFDASSAPLPARRLRPASSHAFGVAEAIELARALGRLPRRLVVIGIEGESFEAGAEPSASAAEGAARAAALARLELEA